MFDIIAPIGSIFNGIHMGFVGHIRYNLYRISYTQVMVRLAYDGNQFHNVFLREYSKWQLTKPNNLFGIGMIFSLNFSLMNFYQLKYAAEK